MTFGVRWQSLIRNGKPIFSRPLKCVWQAESSFSGLNSIFNSIQLCPGEKCTVWCQVVPLESSSVHFQAWCILLTGSTIAWELNMWFNLNFCVTSVARRWLLNLAFQLLFVGTLGNHIIHVFISAPSYVFVLTLLWAAIRKLPLVLVFSWKSSSYWNMNYAVLTKYKN